jgi:hypothetical protein
MEDIVISVLDNYVCLNHHLYYDNFYKNVNLCVHFLHRKTRVCSTMRTNRESRQDLGREAENIMKKQ